LFAESCAEYKLAKPIYSTNAPNSENATKWWVENMSNGIIDCPIDLTLDDSDEESSFCDSGSTCAEKVVLGNQVSDRKLSDEIQTYETETDASVDESVARAENDSIESSENINLNSDLVDLTNDDASQLNVEGLMPDGDHSLHDSPEDKIIRMNQCDENVIPLPDYETQSENSRETNNDDSSYENDHLDNKDLNEERPSHGSDHVEYSSEVIDIEELDNTPINNTNSKLLNNAKSEDFKSEKDIDSRNTNDISFSENSSKDKIKESIDEVNCITIDDEFEHDPHNEISTQSEKCGESNISESNLNQYKQTNEDNNSETGQNNLREENENYTKESCNLQSSVNPNKVYTNSGAHEFFCINIDDDSDVDVEEEVSFSTNTEADDEFKAVENTNENENEKEKEKENSIKNIDKFKNGRPSPVFDGGGQSEDDDSIVLLSGEQYSNIDKKNSSQEEKNESNRHAHSGSREDTNNPSQDPGIDLNLKPTERYDSDSSVCSKLEYLERQKQSDQEKKTLEMMKTASINISLARKRIAARKRARQQPIEFMEMENTKTTKPTTLPQKQKFRPKKQKKRNIMKSALPQSENNVIQGKSEFQQESKHEDEQQKHNSTDKSNLKTALYSDQTSTRNNNKTGEVNSDFPTRLLLDKELQQEIKRKLKKEKLMQEQKQKQKQKEDLKKKQERLFQEAARRAQARLHYENQEKRRNDGESFLNPVFDVKSLPEGHWKWKNLYSRLGLPENCDSLLIKKQFRKLALIYHPDKGGCPTRFNAIKEAYEQLLK